MKMEHDYEDVLTLVWRQLQADIESNKLKQAY